MILAVGLASLFSMMSKASAQPTMILCAMKTIYSSSGTPYGNGYFYMPTALTTSPSYLKIERLFDFSFLTGDQFGGTSPYDPPIRAWPDGRVNMVDIGFVAKAFGAVEGGIRWDYMADLIPDRVVNMKDIAQVAGNFGETGFYLSWPQLRVTVSFDGDQQLPVPTNGILAIPPEAAYFTVSWSSKPIGALVTFWA